MAAHDGQIPKWRIKLVNCDAIAKQMRRYNRIDLCSMRAIALHGKFDRILRIVKSDANQKRVAHHNYAFIILALIVIEYVEKQHMLFRTSDRFPK